MICGDVRILVESWRTLQMSDSVEVASFSGGVMDAYSYLVRGGVLPMLGAETYCFLVRV